MINTLDKFFLRCSGTSSEMLEKYKVPIEVNKGVNIGRAVLLTGISAACTGGYAVSWVFPNPFACCFIGILWGMMIYTLDRHIVSTTYKAENWSFGAAFRNVLRFLLGVVIALTIIVPFELKFFEDLIMTDAINYEVTRQTAELKAEKNAAYAAYRSEVEGKGTGSVKKIGEGPISKALKAQHDILDARLETKIEAIKNDIQTGTIVIGFTARFRTFQVLRAQDPYINKTAWGIQLLFLFVELIPILVKLFSSRGVYDMQIEYREKFAKADLEKSHKLELDEIKRQITLSEAKNHTIPNDNNTSNVSTKNRKKTGNSFQDILTDIPRNLNGY